MLYRITVQGHVDQHWSDWFEGLTLIHGTTGETIIAGVLADQAALYGVLMKIHDLGLTLIAVMPASASAETLARIPDDKDSEHSHDHATRSRSDCSH